MIIVLRLTSSMWLSERLRVRCKVKYLRQEVLHRWVQGTLAQDEVRVRQFQNRGGRNNMGSKIQQNNFPKMCSKLS